MTKKEAIRKVVVFLSTPRPRRKSHGFVLVTTNPEEAKPRKVMRRVYIRQGYRTVLLNDIYSGIEGRKVVKLTGLIYGSKHRYFRRNNICH